MAFGVQGEKVIAECSVCFEFVGVAKSSNRTLSGGWLFVCNLRGAHCCNRKSGTSSVCGCTESWLNTSASVMGSGPSTGEVGKLPFRESTAVVPERRGVIGHGESIMDPGAFRASPLISV